MDCSLPGSSAHENFQARILEWVAISYFHCLQPNSSDKEPTWQCRKCKRLRFNPWVGKISRRRAWQPTPVFLPGESHEQRNLMDMTEATEHIHLLICVQLCNPMDCSTPGFHVLHYLPEFAQTHVTESICYPAISSSIALFSSCPPSFSASESFPMSQLLASGGQNIVASSLPYTKHYAKFFHSSLSHCLSAVL